MKIYLLWHDEKRRATEPFSGVDHAVVDGSCPLCGNPDFRVGGMGRRIAADDHAYEADAVAYCCNQQIGILRVETNTLFGCREDEAVSRMGVKIY